MTGDLDGLAAVVTGGASGIGAATVSMLAERGARVASLDLDASESATVTITCDVTDDASVSAAVAEAAEALGGIDVVVNNAGVGAVGSVEDTEDATFLRLYDVNVLGAVRTTRAALPHLRRSSHAVVVNTGSVAASLGLPARAAYSASKGALHALTRAMAADHVREGIRVCAVSPGTADTPWVQRLLDQADDPASERAALEARQPSGRLVDPREVAAAICALASPGLASSTGTVTTVDGGMTGLRLPT